MTPQAKATQLSLLLHAVLVLGILFFSRSARPETPPLMIDFSLAVAEAAGEPAAVPGPESPAKPATAPPAPPVPQEVTTEKPLEKPQKKQRMLKPQRTKKPVKKKVQPKREPAAEPAPLPTIAAQPEAATPLQTDSSQLAPASAADTAPPGSSAMNPARTSPRSGRHSGGGKGGGGGTAHYSFEYVRNLILRNLTFPDTARKMGLTGKIIVSFLLKEDGQVENIAIVSGSGHTILDNTVVTTIRRIAPFPKPPARAQLVLPIVFNLR